MTDLSIIVVSWNGRGLVLDCLESIEREIRARKDPGRIETETLLVDNGSSDGTVEAVQRRFPWVEVIALPSNVGFAAGNNAGLRRARGRFVVLLNNDTIVLRDAFESCVRYLDRHPEAGVVGPQLLHPDGRKQNSIHNFPSLWTELVPKGVLEVLFPRRFPSKRFARRAPVEVEAVLGACLFVRSEVIETVGPMPEDYFLFLEETDWCFQIRGAGWRVVHVPEARVIHLHGATSKKRAPLPTRIEYQRSLYRFFRKNRGRLQLGIVLALRVVKTALAVVLFAPIALFSSKQRARWRQRLGILLWHARGCPGGAGLAVPRPIQETSS